MTWFPRIFKKSSDSTNTRLSHIFLTNTLSGKKELFVPLKPGTALLYSCGPTVYSQVHIGNLRAYIFSDTLARTLTAGTYRVRRVMNITDVGHLVGDGDRGEDKMALGATREHTTPEAIAERYTKLFLTDLEELNVAIDDITFPRATDYIKEQIALAKTLEEKGFTYRLPDGLYFDTQKFPGYGKLGGLSHAKLEAGARVELVKDKHNPNDFVLWRAAKPNDLQQWDSPWGRGNPGWHIECSAMSRALLGQEIDIHTGGEDLAQIHHNNEIAQSEAAHNRTFVRYWLHNAFLTMNGEKASKSLGNVVYLSDIIAKGFHPLSLRYFFLQANYRSPLSFSWEALEGAAHALERLWKLTSEIARESQHTGAASSEVTDRFLACMRDDLSTPQALSIVWEALRSDEYTFETKWGLIEAAEAHLGLSLTNPSLPQTLSKETLPESIRSLLTERNTARARHDFKEADRLRAIIEQEGYLIKDGPEGPVLTKISL